MRLSEKKAIVFILALCGGVANAQTQMKSDVEIKAEAAQAKVLYDQSNFFAALPLYEDLHVQQPGSVIFDEALAMCLIAKAGQQSDAEGKATLQRAKQIAMEAHAGGDNSNLMQTMLEKFNEPENGSTAPPPVGNEWLKKAEAAFSAGDMKTAMGFYQQALDENPHYYLAALFAGDAEFKQHHYAEAGRWFEKAIAIDPDTETAYRYWGDSLEAAGDHKRAEQEFILAIVASPYSRSTRLGLKQWADKNHAMVVPPPIDLPKRAAPDAKGNTSINVDMTTMMSPAGSGWLVYMMAPTIWQKTEFAKHYPNEKVYRDSLAEQAESLRSVLSVVKANKVPDSKLDTTIKLLRELDAKGMLECWILLDHADQGIAQDYVAYRKDHRELLAQYFATYDVHAM